MPARLPRQNTVVGLEIIEHVGLEDGLEVTNKVFESPPSIVFDQAENRLHTNKARRYARPLRGKGGTPLSC